MDIWDVRIGLLERNRELPDREVVLMRFRELLHQRLSGAGEGEGDAETGASASTGTDVSDSSGDAAVPAEADTDSDGHEEAS